MAFCNCVCPLRELFTWPLVLLLVHTKFTRGNFPVDGLYFELFNYSIISLTILVNTPSARTIPIPHLELMADWLHLRLCPMVLEKQTMTLYVYTTNPIECSCSEWFWRENVGWRTDACYQSHYLPALLSYVVDNPNGFCCRIVKYTGLVNMTIDRRGGGGGWIESSNCVLNGSGIRIRMCPSLWLTD